MVRYILTINRLTRVQTTFASKSLSSFPLLLVRELTSVFREQEVRSSDSKHEIQNAVCSRVSSNLWLDHLWRSVYSRGTGTEWVLCWGVLRLMLVAGSSSEHEHEHEHWSGRCLFVCVFDLALREIIHDVCYKRQSLVRFLLANTFKFWG
jgi:hypothetical protein